MDPFEDIQFDIVKAIRSKWNADFGDTAPTFPRVLILWQSDSDQIEGIGWKQIGNTDPFWLMAAFCRHAADRFDAFEADRMTVDGEETTEGDI